MAAEAMPQTSDPARVRLARAVVVGLLAGFLSGLFGVGGGILVVPALVVAMSMDQRLAHGTSLAAVLPISVSSTLGYALESKVDWPVAALLGAGAVVGAVIGTHVLHVLPQRALAYAFAGLLGATAIRLLVDHSTAGGRSGLTVGAGAALVLIGVAAGVLAGLLGVGGGIVMVPALVVLFSIPPALAKGTSLAVVVPTSVMGTWRNRKKDNADMPIALVVGLGGVVSAFVASKISIGMSDSLSNVLFALLLLVAGVRMLWQMRSPHAAAEAAEGAGPGAGVEPGVP